MASIPKNNLKERMIKLGYNPNIVHIVPPVLDNSRVIDTPILYTKVAQQGQSNFTPPIIPNIEEWSDFEDD